MSRRRNAWLCVACVALGCCASNPPSLASRADEPRNAVDPEKTVEDAGTSTVDANPLVGIWRTNPSQRPASTIVEATLIISPDMSLKFITVRAPAQTPAGFVPANGCVVSDEFDGTYATTILNGSDRFESMFTSGIVNRVEGCAETSLNATGSPASAADVPARVSRGLFPPPSVAYTTTATTLTLFSPGDSYAGVGRDPGTTFTRAQ
jgi:hypothetical protein